MKRFEWVEARTKQEAINQSPAPVAEAMIETNKTARACVIKAGGIDLLDLMKDGTLTPSRVVNIRSLSGLNNVSYDKKQGIAIGPLMTLAEIANNKDIQEKYKALADAASHVATPNIRNAATIGGNLLQRPRCWYFRSTEFDCLKKGGKSCPAKDGENKYHAVFNTDICPITHPSTVAVALVALGASIEITNASGVKEVKAEDFFVAPEKDVLKENILASGELITAIKIPDQDWRSAHIKMGEKDSFDWSTGDCAVALQMENNVCKTASIILGAAAPTPWRAKEAEKYLIGKSINNETASEAGKLALQGAKPLSQNQYKIPMLRAAVKRALLAAN